MVVAEITEALHDLVQAITNEHLEKPSVRKKRQVSISTDSTTWSDLADEFEKLVRFILDGMDVKKW